MDRTLTRLADRRVGDWARAAVARWAIFNGAIFEAFLEQLARADLHDAEPVDARTAILRAIDTLDLPEDVLDGVHAQFDHAVLLRERAERRGRQLALLDVGQLTSGPTAQDVVDDIETADDPFA